MRSPGATRRAPTTPSKGAAIRVRSSARRASSTRALATESSAAARSCCAAEAASRLTSCWVRSQTSCARLRLATASCSRASCSSSRSWKSTAPFLTGWPSSKSTDSITPLVSAFSSTEYSASSCPLKVAMSRRSWGSTFEQLDRDRRRLGGMAGVDAIRTAGERRAASVTSRASSGVARRESGIWSGYRTGMGRGSARRRGRPAGSGRRCDRNRRRGAGLGACRRPRVARSA